MNYNICTCVEHTGKYEACKAGFLCCLINLDVRLTRVGASQKIIPRERFMRQNREGPALPACLPLLQVPLSPTLKKIPALQARKCAHRAN